MNFNDIETMVKSKFKDIKKHAEEIAHEIEVRSGYLRKAEQYKRLEFNLSFESTAKDVQTAKSSANKDSVTVKGKAPNTLYIEKRNLMKQKLEMLGEDIDKNKESLQKAKEIAGEKASEYFNKAMN
ncbi:TPA: type VII secretion substrate EsaC [Staphylococcus aureus]|nr:type VII secretion substrate EsaC [Staphylococcus aureus]